MNKVLIATIVSVLYLNVANAEDINYNHVYINQQTGINDSNTEGTEQNPFKSITYAFLVMKQNRLPDPWFVHIKSGQYDTDPSKPAYEREIFPIDLRDGMTIQGDDDTENCIISGAYISSSKSALFRSDNVKNLFINNLSFKDMNRRSGNGAACELIQSSGKINNCIFTNNKVSSSSYGGGLYIDYGSFEISNNFFTNNYSGYGACIYVYGSLNGNIFNNNFLNNNSPSAHALYITSSLYGDIINNIFLGTSQNDYKSSIVICANMNGNITNNNFNNNNGDDYSTGFYVKSNMNGNIRNNNFNEYMYYGFYVNGSIDGDISKNSFKGIGDNETNYQKGFCIGYNFTGNVSENTFENIDGRGFYISGSFTGDVRENRFYSNIGGFRTANFNGNIFSNLFVNNNSGRESGAGFYITGDIAGNISNNNFVNNITYSTSYRGGGFSVSGCMTGELTNNTFHSNTHNAFYINKKITGNIYDNTFNNNGNSACYINDIIIGKVESNIFCNNSYGIYIGGNSSDPLKIANNFFLYGHGVLSSQNTIIVNNTFYGAGAGVQILNTADQSMIKNNIFSNLSTGIIEEGELNIPIRYNNFYEVNNLIYRNSQGMGSDAFFIEMVLPTFVNNHEESPGIVGENIEFGVWTKDSYYDTDNNTTVFTDSNQNWEKNQWKGAMINLNLGKSTEHRHFLILNNTNNQIIISKKIVDIQYTLECCEYSIDDYRLLETSSNVDSGEDSGILSDFDNEFRPQGGNFDIGADEFFMNQMLPGICYFEPPVANIKQRTVELMAKFNPNGLSATFYFEYGKDSECDMASSVFEGYSGTSLLAVSTEIFNLSPNTQYFFKLVATNNTGTSYGSIQTFKTLSNKSTIFGNLQTDFPGYSGLNIKNATVTIEDIDFTTTTDNNGHFILNELYEGTYTIVVNAPNLIPIKQVVNVGEGQNLDLNIIEMEIISIDSMKEAIDNERNRWDVHGDNRLGLPEAIKALKSAVNISGSGILETDGHSGEGEFGYLRN